jgi:hypothetical protein
MRGELHGINRKLDVHVTLYLAPAAGIDEFLGRLGDDGEAVVIQPVDQRADRRELLILNDGGVVERAQQRAAALEFLEQALVVDIETERLACRMEPSMNSAILSEEDGIRVLTFYRRYRRQGPLDHTRA